MIKKRNRTIFLFLVFTIAVGVVVSLFILLGPPKLLAKSDEPDFCVKCHVLEPYYESWMHAGAHRRKKCVDCHLPNDNIGSHYAWKAIFGLKEVIIFYSGKVPEQIKLTSYGGKVLQYNCVRCHETTVMFIDSERKCWNCHRRISHMHTGVRETF